MLTSAGACASDNSMINVSAVILSRNICLFDTKNVTMNFGSLDPLNPVDVNMNSSVTIRCVGSSPTATFSIADDDGLNETGPNRNRMKHATLNEYLPYTLTIHPASATIPKNTDQTITIAGTVRGTDYQNVSAGAYSDNVIVTVIP